MIVDSMEDYFTETIEKNAAGALRDANWMACHVVRFLKVTNHNEELYYVKSVRDSAKFYLEEWSPEHASLQAMMDYREALTIVDNVEKIVRELGA